MKNDISRRQFVETVAKSLFGLSIAPSFHSLNGGQTTDKFGIAKNVIFINLTGGMSHIDSFDPKENNKINGGILPISTNVAGVTMSSYFPKLAKHADKYSLLRGMTSKSGAHEISEYTMRTSYNKSSLIIHPSLGPIRSFIKGKKHDTLPDSITINPPASHPKHGYLDSKFTPLPILNPSEGLKYSKITVGNSDFNRRIDLLNKLNADYLKHNNTHKTKSYSILYDETLKTLNSKDLEIFDLTKEDSKVREKYGMDSFGQGCLLAKRLVMAGLPYIDLTFGSWDFHVDIQNSMSAKASILDTALSSLYEDLNSSGKLKETIIVVVSEFGRTSFYKDGENYNPYNLNAGRDHQAQAFSAMIGGLNIGGKIIGKTDDLASKVIEDQTTFAEINATVAHFMGIKYDNSWVTPIDSSAPGRPMTVGNGAKPISKLIL